MCRLICSAGCVEFGPDVTSSDKSVKVMLNSQDKVGWADIRGEASAAELSAH